MATPEEIARARGLLTTRLPGMPSPAPVPMAPAPVVVPMGPPMSPEQADAAAMMGLPGAAPVGAPLPDYDPAVHGRVTGLAPTSPAPAMTPDQARAREMLATRAQHGSIDVGPITMSRPAPAAPAPRPAAAAPPKPTLKQIRQGDERRILGTYDTEKAAMGEARDAELVQRDDAAQRTAAMGNEMEARAAEESAQQRDYEFVRRTFRDQTEDMVDRLKKREVDPQRLYGKPEFGSSVAIALGGALAGMYAGMQGRAGNDFVDTLNRNIERDISAQEGQIANEKTAIQERQNLYGQMIASHKDSTLARSQTKNAMLEAAKVQLDAEAQRLGTPAARANADRGIALIDRQQAMLQRDLDAAEEAAAARQAAAAAAARAAREKMMFERGVKLEELRQGNRKLDIEEGKEGGGGGMAGRFVATGNDPTTGRPTGYIARDKESASKAEEGMAAAQNSLAIVDRILKNREEQGKLGRFTSRGEGSFLGTPAWKTQNASDAALLMTELNRASKAGALDAGALEILKKRVANPNAMDLLGDETNDAYRQLRTQLESQIKIGERGAAGQQVTKAIDERGREVIVPTGVQAAPSNARAVQRYNADGSPKR